MPRFVTTKPAFESLESDFRTKVGSAFTLSARVAEEISSPFLAVEITQGSHDVRGNRKLDAFH